MKNKLLLSILLFLIVSGYGQQLPNGNFESWIETGNYQNPVNWNTPNVYSSLAGEAVVDKSDDAFSGEFSARLESKVINFLNQSFLIPGAITLAKFNVDIISQEFSYSGGWFLQQNVFQLKGMYKYHGVGNDSATILMYNFRNRENESYDTIGYGYTYLNDADVWTPFTVNMRYINGHVPDTFNVLIMSTTDEGLQDLSHGGSELFVDSLTIYTNTGILNLWEKPVTLHVFPNPSLSMINFEFEETGKNRKLNIYNPTGKQLSSHTFHDKTISVDMSGYTGGLYSYIVVESGKIINSGSFLKE